MVLAPYYRLYELPWSPTEEVEQRFRKILRIALIIFVVFAHAVPAAASRRDAMLPKAPAIRPRLSS